MEEVLWLNHRDILHSKAGGAERTIFEVSRRLVKRGYRINWLSSQINGLPALQKLEGIDVHRLGGTISSHFKNLLFEKKFRSETVIIDDMAHVIPWLSEIFSTLPGTVFFRHLHRRTLPGQTSPFVCTILKKIESRYPYLYRKWPFITESMQAVDDLKDLGLLDNRIVRIPPGVDLINLQPREKCEHRSIVYFGGMREYKRPHEALYLLLGLKDIYPDVNLKMMGEGKSLPKLKSLAKSLGISEDVEFMGRLSEERLFPVVSEAWLNLHFSVAEGWGYSILESSACGTPTLAYNVPGVSEAISSGQNGVKVPELDRNQLLEKAVEMLDQHEKWQKSSRKYSEQFSWDKTTDMWEKHLNNLE